MSDPIKNAATTAAKVVAGVGPGQLDDPTPRSEFDVRALGNHMTGFLGYGANAVRKGPDMEGEPPDFTQGDWAGTYAALVEDLAQAWAEDGAFEGEVKFGSGMMPAENAAGITLMELTVHAWDLAMATGQQYLLDPKTAQMATTIASAAGPNGRESGFFGPEVEAPDGASDFEKALAASGRDPEWSA